MGDSDVGTGDSEVPFLDVAPADNTTQAVLTVNRPDGTSYTQTASGGTLTPIDGTSPPQNSQRWTADQPAVYDQPGRWVLHWNVTGAGEGAEDLEVFVVASPVAGGPTWLPGRSRVANYLPHRTLALDPAATTEGSEIYELTFDSTTTPDGQTVSRLIADGGAWVAARVAPMHATSQAAATMLVALITAVWVERSWPNDADSLQRANDMERQFNLMLDGLIASNTAAVSGDGDPETIDVVYPTWSFPESDYRFDSSAYF